MTNASAIASSAPAHDDLHLVDETRRRHARLYVARFRPFVVIGFGVPASAWSIVQDPSNIVPRVTMVAVSVLLTLASIAALRIVRDPVSVALGLLALDCAAIVGFVASDGQPEETSTLLLWPILAMAYFASPRAALWTTGACTAVVLGMWEFLPAWNHDRPIPAAAYIIAVGGMFAAFIVQQGRRVEGALVHDRAKDRHALATFEQVDRMRDRLIANVSHELRTPLTATLGSVETLLRDDIELEPAERTHLLHLARDGGHRLLALVEDLLTLGVTRPDAIHLDRGSVDVGVLAREAIDALPADERRDVRLVATFDGTIDADRNRLFQVVTNLVMNAMRHGGDDIEVVVRRAVDDAVEPSVEIAVTDDGAGIDPQHEGELFLPFAKFSSRSDSTGLGLAITRTIVEAHGGTITYRRTRSGRRTEFLVRLPIAAPTHDEAEGSGAR